MIVIATSDRGPEEKAESGRMHQALGRQAAAGVGTGSAFFRRGRIVFSERQDRRSGAGCLMGHIIHLIAIGRTVPAPDSG